MLELERQQHLVDLARECLFRRKIDIARDLHGDRGRALALAARAEVGEHGAGNALVIHAAMLEETRVLDSEHRIGHDLGDFLYGRERAAFLAELAEQRAFG